MKSISNILDITILMRVRSKKNSQQIVRMKNGRSAIIQSKTARDAEKYIRNVVSANYRYCSTTNLVKVTIFAYFKIPKTGKNKDQKKGTYCDLMPDVSNIDNLIHDALEDIVYDNDRQIVSSTTSKFWGEEDRVRILVDEIHETGDL